MGEPTLRELPALWKAKIGDAPWWFIVELEAALAAHPGVEVAALEAIHTDWCTRTEPYGDPMMCGATIADCPGGLGVELRSLVGAALATEAGV